VGQLRSRGAGNDILYGSPLADNLYGGEGDDTIYGVRPVGAMLPGENFSIDPNGTDFIDDSYAAFGVPSVLSPLKTGRKYSIIFPLPTW
jgi:Ca2+-binding RTX toxin-like protein